MRDLQGSRVGWAVSRARAVDKEGKGNGEGHTTQEGDRTEEALTGKLPGQESC